MVEGEKDNNKKLNIEEKYNLIKEDYTRRIWIIIINIILLVLFFVSVVPFLPRYVTDLFNLTEMSFVICWFLMTAIFLILLAITPRYIHIPEISGNELSFFVLHKQYKKLKKILMKKKNGIPPINKWIKHNIRKKIFDLKINVDYIESVPGFENVEYFEKLKTMIRLLEERLIPNIEKEKELETVTKILDSFSMYFLFGKSDTVDSIIKTTRNMPTVEIVKKRRIITLESLFKSKNIIVCFLSWLFLFLLIIGIITYILSRYGEIPMYQIHASIISVIVASGIISASIQRISKK